MPTQMVSTLVKKVMKKFINDFGPIKFDEIDDGTYKMLCDDVI